MAIKTEVPVGAKLQSNSRNHASTAPPPHAQEQQQQATAYATLPTITEEVSDQEQPQQVECIDLTTPHVHLPSAAVKPPTSGNGITEAQAYMKSRLENLTSANNTTTQNPSPAASTPCPTTGTPHVPHPVTNTTLIDTTPSSPSQPAAATRTVQKLSAAGRGAQARTTTPGAAPSSAAKLNSILRSLTFRTRHLQQHQEHQQKRSLPAMMAPNSDNGSGGMAPTNGRNNPQEFKIAEAKPLKRTIKPMDTTLPPQKADRSNNASAAVGGSQPLFAHFSYRKPQPGDAVAKELGTASASNLGSRRGGAVKRSVVVPEQHQDLAALTTTIATAAGVGHSNNNTKKRIKPTNTSHHAWSAFASLTTNAAPVVVVPDNTANAEVGSGGNLQENNNNDKTMEAAEGQKESLFGDDSGFLDLSKTFAFL